MSAGWDTGPECWGVCPKGNMLKEEGAALCNILLSALVSCQGEDTSIFLSIIVFYNFVGLNNTRPL